ncbi:hypothetical protein QMZ30_00200 [Pantoea sp. EA-12]|uniref:hypothetical protein n=1 Tax=Pantoea sp. EA-12 TaxID=3043303 RepID=UPI0024B5C53D|nr:hypothetical protein [Pantoea sp. EA-12]MDI9219313.1 hypothetical protein [Pantoea sp. EA-12]
MKIYLSKKSIPELNKLTSLQRKRNYREAARLASTHIEYWVGAGLFVLLLIILSMLFKKVYPGPDTFLRDVLRWVTTFIPAAFVFVQFKIYAMRKHYRHILLRTE